MRYEFKHTVPVDILDDFRDAVMPFLGYDPYMADADEKGYTVRSIYFDTPCYDYYHEKKEGLKVRKKIRIRGYNEGGPDSLIFLEVKRKDEKKVWKNRAPMIYKDLGSLFETGDVEEYILQDMKFKHPAEDARRFLFHMRNYSLLPVVLVIYEREAYFGKFDHSLRITFDKNLRSSIKPDIGDLFQEKGIKYSNVGHFVLEVKFNDIFPRWLASIITSFGLKLGSFSKFTTCIDEHMVVYNNMRDLNRDYINSFDTDIRCKKGVNY